MDKSIRINISLKNILFEDDENKKYEKLNKGEKYKNSYPLEQKTINNSPYLTTDKIFVEKIKIDIIDDSQKIETIYDKKADEKDVPIEWMAMQDTDSNLKTFNIDKPET